MCIIMRYKKESAWLDGFPECRLYLGAIFIGIPLSMREFSEVGNMTAVTVLASVWLPTAGTIVIDMLRGRISYLSIFFFFVWVALIIGYGILVNVR